MKPEPQVLIPLSEYESLAFEAKLKPNYWVPAFIEPALGNEFKTFNLVLRKNVNGGMQRLRIGTLTAKEAENLKGYKICVFKDEFFKEDERTDNQT